jgi:hypothetical protein
MSKVGRFVVDPKAGAYCDITLDGGDKIVVNHDKGGTKGGRLSIEKKGWLGLGGQRVFACDLDGPEGRAAMTRLTQGVPADSARATPLGAFVELVKDCKSVDEVRSCCEALLAGR